MSILITCHRCEAKGITNIFDRTQGVCGICYDLESDIKKGDFKHTKLKTYQELKNDFKKMGILDKEIGDI